jgi:hypothetical protein
VNTNQTEIIRRMQDAAIALIHSLRREQRERIALLFADEAERENWHYIPRNRAGLPLQEMDPQQRLLAHDLVKAGLSVKAYKKVCDIIALEPVLATLEGSGRKFSRDPDLYFVSIFGDPSEDLLWGWRFEGHHVSLNFTVVGGHQVGTAPLFFGANPAHVRHGEKSGFRALKEEEDLGRELVMMLDEDQRRRAVLPVEAPSDILTRNLPHVEGELAPEGLQTSAMTTAQQELLSDLVQTYVSRLPEPLAGLETERIERGPKENCFFAWAGSANPGAPHYYRIHGPHFLAEYDNTQNDANHIHAVWRDIQNDFAVDFLRRHYARRHRSA